MTFYRSLFAATLVAVFTTGTAATAQDPGACEPFTLVTAGGNRAVEFVDVGSDGPGPGDMRIGYRSFVDQAGNPAGHLRWITTVLNEPGDDGTPGESYEVNVALLDNGHIGFHRLIQTTNPAQDTGQIVWSPTELDSGFITGGTGAYAGAQGVVRLIRDGRSVTAEFDLDCNR